MHRRFSVVAVVTAIGFAVLPIYILIHPEENDPVWLSVVFIVISAGQRRLKARIAAPAGSV